MNSTIQGISVADESLGPLTLGGFLRDVYEHNSDREALVFYPPTGAVVRRSYAQVWQEANVVARALIARGVTKETRVGLLATNCPEWITAMFGIALAGGTCVLLSTFARGPELEYALRVGDVALLIFERSVLARDFAAELAELCPALAGREREIRSTRFPFLRGAVCIGDRAPGAFEHWPEFLQCNLAPQALVDAIGAEIAPTDRALIFFSSGTTAKPKAVVHMHRAATMMCWRWRRIYGIDAAVRTWCANGFFWSGNFASGMGATFAAGGCLILQRHFDTGEALRLMQAERVSLPVAWPHQWARLIADPAWSSTDLSALHYVGDRSLARSHPDVTSKWPEPTAAYGSTETFTLVTAPADNSWEAIAEDHHGVPLAGNTIRIVDPMTSTVLGVNEEGEIAVKGPTLMCGYLRVAPEDAFDADGFFRTGDGGFVDPQGRLHWQGRLTAIIKTGGANVSPPEIDAVLAKYPGVKIGATVGVPHETLGEMVVACIVPEDGATLEESAVRAFLSKHLSSYKVPRRVLFLLESDLSLTGTAKVKIAPLREFATRRLAEAT
jgi:acyl-CoA synthetase (AMP-forming)/AMP-acid ligase II